ncbi:serine hydrolase domain-containing protein [Aeromicrobium alkaliterrae]
MTLSLSALAVGASLLAGGAAMAGSARSTNDATSADRLDAFVRDQMQRADVPGAAYAVVGPEGVRLEGTFGTDGAGDPVTAATPFLWGSVAKPVAATLVVLLADDGLLDLDDLVVEHLPEFRAADPAVSDRITVRHLLEQTSGIPDLLTLTDRYDDHRPSDVVAELSDVDLVGDPGKNHVYSSVNYLVLAAVVEEVTSRPFADVLDERLLEPVGASSAVTGVVDEGRLPPGHRYVAGRAVPFTTQIDPAGTAYGYLGGDLHDLAAFAQASLPGGPLLTDDERTRLTDPAVETGDDSAYGLGWRTWEVPGTGDPMVWHSGAVPGYQASIVLLPDRDEAVVVVQNAYGAFQEPELLDTAWGLATIRSGGEPELSGAGPTYPVVLGAFGVLAAGLAVLTARSGWRLVRRRSPRGRLGVAAWLVPLGLVGAVAWMVPGLFGVDRDHLPLWAPDVAWLLDATLVLVAVLAALRVAITAREWISAPPRVDSRP